MPSSAPSRLVVSWLLYLTFPLSLCLCSVGRAQRVSIRSLGWDGQLTIDGITSIPFNFGVQGIVEVGLDTSHILLLWR